MTLATLATAVAAQLEVLVHANTVIRLTNQQDSDATVDDTVLTAAANMASRRVRRKLGDVSEDDDDAVDFAVRLALLELATFWSLTLTEGGLSYVAGINADIAEEARARRQANSVMQLSLEDMMDEDERWDDVRDDLWDSTTNDEDY